MSVIIHVRVRPCEGSKGCDFVDDDDDKGWDFLNPSFVPRDGFDGEVELRRNV